MSKTPETALPDDDNIQFGAAQVPTLETGSYKIVVNGEIGAATAGEIVGGTMASETSAATLNLEVYGNRFALDPTDVTARYPAPGASGVYEADLPYVVLSHAALPWITPMSKSDSSVPWLALLMFQGEDPAPKLTAMTLGDLKSDPNAGVFFPSELNLMEWEQASQSVNVVDVPIDLFSAIAPSAADLPLLAHTLQVTPASGAPEQYSLVLSNRLPSLTTQCSVFLVSLEFYLDYLPGAGSAPDFGDFKSVRLVTLDHWNFTNTDTSESFVEYIEGLNGGLALDKEIPPLMTLQLPFQSDANDPTGSTAVEDAFGLGYVALPHNTRQGDFTVSWYRGPLAPFTVTNTGSNGSTSSDQSLRYNPDTGMFDVSYAAAWQLGRGLALSNQRIAAAQATVQLSNKEIAAAAGQKAAIKSNLALENTDDAALQTSVERAMIEKIVKFLGGQGPRP